jgi:hypothetical protein
MIMFSFLPSNCLNWRRQQFRQNRPLALRTGSAGGLAAGILIRGKTLVTGGKTAGATCAKRKGTVLL